MKIAAELGGSDLKVFIEGSNWKKTTQPFNKEVVKVGLVAYIIDGEPINHDAISRSELDTHPSLMFCRDELTLADFKKELKKAGYGEPGEIRLGNSRFALKKQLTDAYTLTFYNYCNNEAFNEWLASLPTHEAGFLLQKMAAGISPESSLSSGNSKTSKPSSVTGSIYGMRRL